MPKSCVVWGCHAIFKPTAGLGFYGFPNATSKGAQRRLWIEKLRRVDNPVEGSPAAAGIRNIAGGSVSTSRCVATWQPSKWDKVCGEALHNRCVMCCVCVCVCVVCVCGGGGGGGGGGGESQEFFFSYTYLLLYLVIFWWNWSGVEARVLKSTFVEVVGCGLVPLGNKP